MNEKTDTEKGRPFETGLIDAADIAFDIDGVVADTFRSFVTLAEKDHGIRIHYETITEYEFWKVLDISEHHTRTIIHKILEQPVEIGIRPISGARDVIMSLLQTGPVRFVTARPDPGSILRWMTEVLEIPCTDGILLEATGDPDLKASFLAREEVKYFVEDRLETCYSLQDASIVPIVFDQPWNRKPSSFMRVRDWREIAAIIQWPEGTAPFPAAPEDDAEGGAAL